METQAHQEQLADLDCLEVWDLLEPLDLKEVKVFLVKLDLVVLLVTMEVLVSMAMLAMMEMLEIQVLQDPSVFKVNREHQESKVSQGVKEIRDPQAHQETLVL